MKTSLLKYAWYPYESVMSTVLKKVGLRYYSEEFYDHIRATELAQHLPGNTFRKFFKFAFVRNPWDWMLSSYTYYLRNKHVVACVYF